MENHADLLVIFGITGDLARRMTFRALYRLERRGLLYGPVIGVASEDMTTGELIMQPLLDHPPDVRPYPRGSWGPDDAETLVRGHPRWQPPWLPADG